MMLLPVALTRQRATTAPEIDADVALDVRRQHSRNIMIGLTAPTPLRPRRLPPNRGVSPGINASLRGADGAVKQSHKR
jgi:hypothetical protein